VSGRAADAVRPSLPPALALAAGVWVGVFVAEATSWRVHAGGAPWWLVLLPIAVVLAVFPVAWLRGAPAALRFLAVGLVAGAVCGAAYWGWWRAEAASLAKGGAHEWTATVAEEPQLKDAEQQVRVALRGGGTAVVTWPSAETLEYGESVSFRAALRPPDAKSSFARVLERRGDLGEGRAWSTAVLGWRGLAGPLLRERASLLRALAGERGDGWTLLSAVVLGDRRGVTGSPVEQAFQVAGVPHLLAASALYLGLVCLLAQRLARACRLRPPVQLLAACGAGLAYAAVAGLRASVVRGLLMFAVASGVSLAGRRRDALASVALVAAGMLAAFPPVAFDLGFALGVSVVCGLGVFGGLVRGWVRAILPEWASGVVPATAAAVTAQLSALPLAAGAFGMLSLVGPAAVVVVLPLASAGLTMGVAGSLVWWLEPACGAALLRLSAGIFATAGRIACAFASLPHAAVPLGPLSAIAGVLGALAIGALWVAWPRPPRVRRARWIAVGLATALLAPSPGAFSAADARLVVMDVGQGDAILLRDGSASMLVDTGPRTAVLRAALARQRVRSLQCVVLTHSHADHVGGFAGLAGVVTVGWVGGPLVASRSEFAKVSGMAARLTPARADRWRTLQAGESWTVGGTRVRVLWPEVADPSLSPNDTSVILELQRGGFSAILTGDAEQRPQQRLVDESEATHVEVLKVAHHGSTNGLLEASLAAWSPRAALISVGAGNDYGHPARGTLDALSAAGADVHRTDLEGDLEVDVGQTSWALRRGGVRVGCATIEPVRRPAGASSSRLPATERHGRERPFRPEARLPHLRRRGPSAAARGPPLEGPSC
jgi:competence protein ComEC